MNEAMQNPESLLAAKIDVYNKDGKIIGRVSRETAKKFVVSGSYYVITTEDIVLR